MNWLEALILGLIQGLTEFLPVSSSGHIELGKAILNINAESTLTFTIVLHGATVLSTIVIFHKDIAFLLKGLFSFKWNEETKYIFKICISTLPVAIIGIFFKDEIEQLFSGNILLVGFMLLITALLLGFTYFASPREKKIYFSHAVIIGISQAIAIMPGISRSGFTIATGLLLGNNKEETARFSFLMVLLPVIGANFLNLLDKDAVNTDTSASVLIIGFLTAFFSGLAACKWMIAIVKREKLVFFAVYCFIVGTIAILYAIL